jgi:hypothetical protein
MTMGIYARAALCSRQLPRMKSRGLRCPGRSERPYVPEFGDAAAYESELSQLLINVEKRDLKLSEWCQRTLDGG